MMMNFTARNRPPVNGCTDFNGRVWRREEVLSLALSMHGRCGRGAMSMEPPAALAAAWRIEGGCVCILHLLHLSACMRQRRLR
jgi:hypothetical protein